METLSAYIYSPLSPGEGQGEGGGQIVLHYEESGAAVSGPLSDTDLTHRYLWSTGTDELLADEVVDDGTADDVLWTLADHLNSVRDWVVYDDNGASTLDDDTVTVVKHVVYDAYGNVTSDTAPGVDSLFLYTGRAFDAETGLQNNLHRWYDSSVGSWLKADPMGFAAADANLYRYCGNGPTNWLDPSGLVEVHFETGTFDSSNIGHSCDTDVSKKDFWDEPVKPVKDPREGMGTWEKFIFPLTSTVIQQKQVHDAERDKRLLEGGPNAIRDGYDLDRYKELTLSKREYEKWKDKWRENQPHNYKFDITGIRPGPQSQADALVNIAEEHGWATAIWMPGGLFDNGIIAMGGLAGAPPVEMRVETMPSEAARYRAYWSQDYNLINSTRQRTHTTPGTRSIVDQKLSGTGELYPRQTIYDEFGRRIGNNDFTSHGRPVEEHPNPHHHPNPPCNPTQHGPVTPGLHPGTPQ